MICTSSRRRALSFSSSPSRMAEKVESAAPRGPPPNAVPRHPQALERLGVCGGIGRALVSGGADHDVDGAAAGGPRGERAAAGDVRVVRMGVDSERARRRASSRDAVMAPRSLRPRSRRGSSGDSPSGLAPPPCSIARARARNRPPARIPCTHWRNAPLPPRRGSSGLPAPPGRAARFGPPGRATRPSARRLQPAPRAARGRRAVLAGGTGAGDHLAPVEGLPMADRLTTHSTAWFTRSTVVNRRVHERHSRRRRIASPCSTSRESTTRSSVAPHHGQRTT